MGDIKVFDKYSRSELGSFSLMGKTEVEKLLCEAQKSFLNLKLTSAGERASWLKNLSSLLEKNTERFAGLIAAEAGKPLAYARSEVERSVATINFAISECLSLAGEVVPVDFGAGSGKQAYTQRFATGVVLGISPFNFPLNLILHKLAPAIAVGAPIIIKPSFFTPLTAIALEELCIEAGFPSGAFQVALCEDDLTEMMLKDERVTYFSFTGSPQVGWELKAKVPKKKVTLELGGNAAVIVDQTADLEKASDLIAKGAFLYAGQICISTQRIYVQDEIYNRFINMLVEKTEALKIGDPHDENVLIGPIIDDAHYSRIESWIEEARSSKAQILCGGEAFDEEHNLYKPTIISNAGKDLKVVCEEVFGPVAIIEKYSHFSHAIKEVNSSRFGLQAGVFTNRLDHMKEAFSNLEVAAVMINNIPGFRVDSMPYGGVKESGFGREGLKYAMLDMTETKLLVY